MPGWVRARTDEDFAKNQRRLTSMERSYRQIAACLQAAGIEFLALKGLTQCPAFGCEPAHRVQYDIDLYVPGQAVFRARDALRETGLEPIAGMDGFPTDHLPVMIRKTGWEWRGDFFDPEIPEAVELHFQFWNEGLDRLPAPGVNNFWARREFRTVADVRVACLRRSDAVAYSSLHLLKHLLRGSVKPFHVLELARFLHLHAEDAAFWEEWHESHCAEVRRLQAPSFGLAEKWFGCELPSAARAEIAALPSPAQAWFQQFAYSPAAVPFHGNKDELWLHLALVESLRDRIAVLRRRLLPGRLPGPVDAVHTPLDRMTPWLRLRRRLRYAAYVAGRIRHHALALPKTALTGALWWLRGTGLGNGFWTFLAAGLLFNFALFIFVLLYNLHLLDLGFREDLMGILNGFSTAGTVAGTLPAAWIARRFGLRRSLLGAFSAAAVLVVLRSLAATAFPLAALAFLWGLVFAVWAVVFPPIVAGSVEERRRPAAFSLFFGAMFATGIAADWVAGQLPRLLHGKQAALLLSGALVTLALVPAWRLKPAAAAPARSRIYPRSAFLFRYLGIFAIWNLATGSFNPFANAFFARQHLPVERIGAVFSLSQLAQVGGVLAAPLVFRRSGLAGGVAWMMAATALGLAGLASGPAGSTLAGGYIAYMVCQWMSEPGLSTLLMNRVAEREREGASALNYLVAFTAQAAASFAAGHLLTRFGYGAVLSGAALTAVLSALLMRMWLAHDTPPLPAIGRASAGDNVPG